MALQAERDELLEKMLSAVTSVQIKYGGHSGLAVEQDSSVAYMCRSIEDVLLHRVKYRKNIVANIIKDDEDILMWDLITRFMTRSEVSRFESEKSLKSGMARVRSWIRSALNDGLLEKYLSSLNKADAALLRIYYHNDAFMLDAPLTGALPDICAGLSSVLFSFDLDKEEFNLPLRRENTPEALRDNTPPASPLKVTVARQHSKLKKKVSRAHIVELPDVTESGREKVLTEPAVDVSKIAARLIPDSVESDFDFKSISLLVCDKESDSDDEEGFRARLNTDGQGISIVPKPPSIKRKPSVIEEVVTSSDSEDESNTLKRESIPIKGPTSSLSTSYMSMPHSVSPALSASHLMGTSAPCVSMLERSYEIGTIIDQSIEMSIERGEEVLTPPSAPGLSLVPGPPVFEPLKQFVQAVERVKEALPEESVFEPPSLHTVSEEGTEDTVSVSVEEQWSIASDSTEDYSTSVSEVIKDEPAFSVQAATPERGDDIGAMFEAASISSLLEDSTEEVRNSMQDELPRSSSVISKPYSPVAAEILSRRMDAMRRLSLGPPSTARMPPEGQSSSKGAKEWDDQYVSSDNLSMCSDASSAPGITHGSFRSTGDGTESLCDSISTYESNTYTAGELKQVLMSLLQQKDEMEGEKSKLQEALTREIRLSNELRNEVEGTRQSFLKRGTHDEQVIRGLQRENLMLKQQLKKYVSAIQQLRRDEDFPPDSILSQVLVEVPVVQPLALPSPHNISPYDNKALETKLAQVSEMHGELVELNQVLVTTGIARDRRLAELETTLKNIQERESGKNKKREEKNTRLKKGNSLSEFTMVESPLLQLYIPTALLRGTGNNRHHVYQIHIRVGEDEWNVYRRYAQFRLLHHQLIEKYPLFNKLEIPGKNRFGRKVAAVVEERRAKLEHYLQTVMSNLAEQGFGLDQDTMDLHSDPTREALTNAIHFFRDKPEDSESARGRTGSSSLFYTSSSNTL